MSDNYLLARDELNERQQVQLDNFLRRFQRAWAQDDEPDLPALPSDQENPLRGRMLVELIKMDQDFRCRWLKSKSLELYLAEWGELTDCRPARLELLRGECLSRTVYSTGVTAEELERRFPELADEIDLLDLQRQAEMVRLRDSYARSERFFNLQKLGEGGMGVVYKALDCQRQAIVALKALPHIHPRRLLQFKREFRSLAEIVHPNLVPLYELFAEGEEREQWFFTMELVDGVDFLSYVRHALTPTDQALASTMTHPEPTAGASGADRPSWQTGSAAVDESRLRETLRQLAEGVMALHNEGKLHRDLKPSNVLVKKDGHIVVLDFGLVTELEAQEESISAGDDTRSSWSSMEVSNWQAVGTAHYMSPEQAAGRPLTPASDWYAVGVMLYEALTGQRPFSGDADVVQSQKRYSDPPPPSQRASNVPNDLNALCTDLLCRDPTRRPTGREILRRLGGAIKAPLRVESANPATAPFVGRQRHLQQLHAALRQMLQGNAVTVHVRGRSGEGKSRLIQRFLRDVHARRQVVILAGRCFERESVPYKAIDSLVDALSRYLGTLQDREAKSLLPEDIAALARVFPVLRQIGAVVQVTSENTLETPDLQELRRRAFRALRQLLTNLSRTMPVVLHIDDLQWGDEDSAAVLAELMRPPDPPRLLLLVCYRSEYEGENECLRALKAATESAPVNKFWHEVDVGPFTHEDALRLAHALLGEANGHPQDYAETIAQESGGSPYFLFELVNFFQAAAGEGDVRSKTPVDLDEVLWNRVQRLPPPARQVLEVLAVAGRPLPLRYIHRAADLPDRDQQTVAFLRSGHFVRTDGPSLDHDAETFHDRIRESVVAHLSRQDQSRYHLRLATLLEDERWPDAETVAAHFDGGGQPQKAGHYYMTAADQAAETLAFDRAVRLYKLSFELNAPAGDKGRKLRIKLAHALANAGRGAEAAREYEFAGRGAEGDEALDLDRMAGYQYCISGHVQEGIGALRKVLGRAGMQMPKTPTRSLISILLRRMLLRFRGLDFDERSNDDLPDDVLRKIDVTWSVACGLSMFDTVRGADFQMRNVLLALRAGEPYRIARALALEAGFQATEGSRASRRVEELLQRARDLAQRIDHPHALGMVALMTGITRFHFGRFNEAGECFERADKILRDQCTGVAWELDTTQTFATWSHMQTGDLARMRSEAQRLLMEADERGDLHMATNLGVYAIPLSRLLTDEPDEGERECRAALARWSQDGFHIQHLTALYCQTYLDLYRGNGVRACDRFGEQWKPLAKSILLHFQVCRIMATHLRGLAAVAAAVESKQAKYLKAAVKDAKRLKREKVPWADALATKLQACIAAARGYRESALRISAAAANQLQEQQMHLFAMSLRHERGRFLGGDEGAALVEQFNAWSASLQAADPSRLAAMCAPGYPA